MTTPENQDTFAGLLTSLDACKSAVDRRTTQSESQDYAFGPSNLHRALVLAAFDILEHPEKSIDRYESCCRSAFLQEHSETKKLRVSFETCGSRYCPKCGTEYRRKLADMLDLQIGPVKKNRWRFVTLTLLSTDDRLADRLDHLIKSFRRLRQQQIWEITQIHWRAVIEITFNQKTRQWHPHIHILSKGNFLPQKKLAQAWSIATKDSSIVDIRMIKNKGQAVHYVAKYLGKTPKFEDTDDPLGRTVEYLEAMINRKVVLASKGICFDDDESPPTTPEKTQGEWFFIAGFSEVVEAVQNKEAWAISLMERLYRGHTEPKQPEFFDSD